MIRVEHLYKSYTPERMVLSNLNLELQAGELAFLTGPSGSGKTTLFKILCAFERPTSGRAQVGHFVLNDLRRSQIPEFRQSIGVVFQDYKLLHQLTVFENVALALEVRGISAEKIRPRVDQILDMVGLSHKVSELPPILSGGEKQRVAIARALVHEPRVLIADEPTGNLDSDLTKDIMKIFERAANRGTTVLIATHDLNLIQQNDTSARTRLSLHEGALV
jgi:cell division transport system ATP-binding protein